MIHLIDESGEMIRVVGSGSLAKLATGEYVTPGACVWHPNGSSLVVDAVSEFRVYNGSFSLVARECYHSRIEAEQAAKDTQ